MKSTMQDFPLTISHMLRHGRQVFSRSRVSTFDGEVFTTVDFAEVAGRAERLAAALVRLGVAADDRVGTLCWNHHQHLEAYLAVPSMGAVLHTLNLRLPPEQLAYVINQGEDKVIIADATTLPLLARIYDQLKSVEHVVMVGDLAELAAVSGPSQLEALADHPAASRLLSYEELLAGEEPGFSWPRLDEHQAAAMCHTTGTTGQPKGVLYSHRSVFLHSLAATSGNCLGMSQSDRVLPVVPMFHVLAWGAPYEAWIAGADLVMPHRFLQPAFLTRQIELSQATLSLGVPTIWNGVLEYGLAHPEVDLSSLRGVTAGGAAVPQALIEGFRARFGVTMIQGWGLTETSPMVTLAVAPKEFDPDDMYWRSKAGRVLIGVEARVVADDGTEVANDGVAWGEIEVRGPWVTGSYYREDDQSRFHDGWLRTGDVGTLDDYGFVTIVDRAKDVIKTGGEWISSVDLENALMAHPDILEAAVIGVPDERWSERPLAVVVAKADAKPDFVELRDFLAGRMPRWWLPERWALVDEIPKTSVGKFDKRKLRALYAGDEIVAVSLT